MQGKIIHETIIKSPRMSNVLIKTQLDPLLIKTNYCVAQAGV